MTVRQLQFGPYFLNFFDRFFLLRPIFCFYLFAPKGCPLCLKNTFFSSRTDRFFKTPNSYPLEKAYFGE